MRLSKNLMRERADLEFTKSNIYSLYEWASSLEVEISALKRIIANLRRKIGGGTDGDNTS